MLFIPGCFARHKTATYSIRERVTEDGLMEYPIWWR